MAKRVKFKHTTSVPVKKSASAIQEMLGEIGAKLVMLEYDNTRQLVGISFTVVLGSSEIPYKIPVRWKHIFDYLKEEKLETGNVNRFAEDWELKLEDQARKIAWRLAHDWLKSQLAFVEFGVRRPEELFLADMVVQDGQTLGDMFSAGKLPKLLGG